MGAPIRVSRLMIVNHALTQAAEEKIKRKLNIEASSQGLAARVCCRALGNTRRRCFPGLNKLPSSRHPPGKGVGPGMRNIVDLKCISAQGSKDRCLVQMLLTLTYPSDSGSTKEKVFTRRHLPNTLFGAVGSMRIWYTILHSQSIFSP